MLAYYWLGRLEVELRARISQKMSEAETRAEHIDPALEGSKNSCCTRPLAAN
jgi:hypothetical protein